MAAWLEPLKLETFIINIFAGDIMYFIGIAIVAIGMFAGFFRMTTLMFFALLGLFLLMFSGVAMNYLVVLFILIGAYIAGIVLSKTKER